LAVVLTVMYGKFYQLIQLILRYSAAIDITTGVHVAIKKIPKAFTHSIEDTKRILREIKILRQLSHPNVVLATKFNLSIDN
jgi:serine/threonine protein kinase